MIGKTIKVDTNANDSATFGRSHTYTRVQKRQMENLSRSKEKLSESVQSPAKRTNENHFRCVSESKRIKDSIESRAVADRYRVLS